MTLPTAPNAPAPPLAAATPAPRRLQRDVLKRAFGQVAWSQKGKVTDIVGTIVEAHLPGARYGMLVTIEGPKDSPPVLAEVVSFQKEGKAMLLPYGALTGIHPGCVVGDMQLYD